MYDKLNLIKPDEIEVTQKTLKNLSIVLKEVTQINESTDDECIDMINPNLRNLGTGPRNVPKDFGANRSEILACKFFRLANIVREKNDENKQKEDTSSEISEKITTRENEQQNETIVEDYQQAEETRSNTEDGEEIDNSRQSVISDCAEEGQENPVTQLLETINNTEASDTEASVENEEEIVNSRESVISECAEDGEENLVTQLLETMNNTEASVENKEEIDNSQQTVIADDAEESKQKDENLVTLLLETINSAENSINSQSCQNNEPVPFIVLPHPEKLEKNNEKSEARDSVEPISVQKDTLEEEFSYENLKASEKNNIYQSCKKQLRDVLKITKKGFFKKVVNPLKQFSSKVCASVKNRFQSDSTIQVYNFKTGDLNPEAMKIVKEEYVCRIICQILQYIKIFHGMQDGMFHKEGNSKMAENFILDVDRRVKFFINAVSSQVACSKEAQRLKYARKYEKIDDDFREDVSDLLKNASISKYLLSNKHFHKLSGHTLVLVVHRLIAQYFDGFLDPELVDSLDKYMKNDFELSSNFERIHPKEHFKSKFKDIQQLFINSIEPNRRKILNGLFDTLEWIDKFNSNEQMNVRSIIGTLTKLFYPFNKLKKDKRPLFYKLRCTLTLPKHPFGKNIMVNELVNELYKANLNGQLMNKI